MPLRRILKTLPAGLMATRTLHGELGLIQTTGFHSSEDGNDFILALDGVTSIVRELLDQHSVKESQIDNLLMVISPMKEATVYINECAQHIQVRARHQLNAGQHISENDIADIEGLELRDRNQTLIPMPNDCGLVLILSVGWRKCLYYDFSVLVPNAVERSDDLIKLFGSLYARLLFQSVFAMSDEQWDRILNWGWFPFMGLSSDDREKLISWSNEDRYPTSLIDEVCKNYSRELPSRINSWKKSSSLEFHAPFFHSALSCYERQDYVGCIQTLFPRIEGILRSLHLHLWPSKDAKQESLSSTVEAIQRDDSLMLPVRFRRWLREWYFQNFNEKNADVPLSRNSIGHGVSAAADYDFATATLGFLAVDQLFYYLRVRDL